MLAAYILVDAEPGAIPNVIRLLKDIDGVRSASRVTGPYDVIVRVEAKGEDALANVLEERLRRVPGVRRTITCLVVTGRRS